MRSILAIGLSLSLLGACTQTHSGSDRLAARASLKLPSSPTLFAAGPSDEAQSIAAAAAGFAARLGDATHPARRIHPEDAPLLAGSPEGRAFLSAPATGRAFAVGVPEATCPARTAGIGTNAARAGTAAIMACRAQLDAADAPDACGCALIALDDALLAPQSVFAYAPGVSARIEATELGLDLYLVARESAAQGGGRRIDFHPAPGDRLSVEIARDGGAVVRWLEPDGEAVTFEGRRFADGLRRGRFAERILAEDPQGRRIRIVIGVEPVEYALRRRELTLWPPGV